MKPVIIKLNFSKIEAVSDRTSRALLKDIAQLCRRAQRAEVDQFMEHSGLSRRERQSIRDQIADELSSGPAFYMKEIKTGSIEIMVAVSALGLWLLQLTVGETIKEAWKKGKIHKDIVDWIENKRPTELTKLIDEEVKKHDFLSGRAIVVRVEEVKKTRVIEIHLGPAPDIIIKDATPILDDQIVKRSREYLDKQ